jgi:hypothetical protein
VNFDDRDVLEVPDVRNADFVGAHHEPLAATGIGSVST